MLGNPGVDFDFLQGQSAKQIRMKNRFDQLLRVLRKTFLELHLLQVSNIELLVLHYKWQGPVEQDVENDSQAPHVGHLSGVLTVLQNLWTDVVVSA